MDEEACLPDRVGIEDEKEEELGRGLGTAGEVGGEVGGYWRCREQVLEESELVRVMLERLRLTGWSHM